MKNHKQLNIFEMSFDEFISRFTGKVYGPYSEFLRNPTRYGGKLKSHIECEWTSGDHFAHDNYQRGHLPQLCIKASGWKAKLLALFLWPESPYIPHNNYVVWWKNGDHPNDDVYRPFEDTGKIPTEPREGKVVRYFRHPQISGDSICVNCERKMNDHGWIDTGEYDTGEYGIKVCPGDYIKTNLTGKE
jgi:hypothetical protein